MSKVLLRKSVTLNLGNYESVKIEIGVEVDTEKDELTELLHAKKVLVRQMEFVDTALQAEVDEWSPRRSSTKKFQVRS